MKLSERIQALHQLGIHLQSLTPSNREEICQRAANENPWFTAPNVIRSLDSIQGQLNHAELTRWTSSYNFDTTEPKTIGLVMAGNLPLVGFHDFLCTLVSGHRVKAKLSSQDSYLITYLKETLFEIEPSFRPFIEFADRLNHIDAVIATGSDNTSRYFEYYFRSIPRIIRKNRSSFGVIMGEESTPDLTELGTDVFSYFGLGCRNVSKLYVPEKYDFRNMFESWEVHRSVIHHHKYANNYDYQKSILLVNQVPFLDNGFVMLNESTSFVSPISILYYETYADQPDLLQKLASQESKIQCIVSAKSWLAGSLSFGHAQFPKLDDYADNVNTLKFLESIA